MSSIFIGGVSGMAADVTAYNSNWDALEASLQDLGPAVISGLVPSAGTGLAVNVTAGTASIGGQVVKASTFIIGGLTPSTTVHLYLQRDGTGTSNTTGTQPANSVKLGTAVTGVGTVTSVDTNRSSGRQAKVRTENLVPGGPGAGNPGSIDLSQWNATAGNGFTVFGTLPAGAVPVSSSIIKDDANQNSVQTALTIGHTYNAGGGATGIGVEFDMLVESSTNGTTKVAANLQATLTDLTPATATGKLSVGVIDNNTQVIPLTVATKDIRIPQAPAASAQHGLLNIGSGGFDGSANHFAGDSPGTYLAMNAPSGYTGTYIDVQKAGARLFYLDQFGTLFRLSAPVGTANDGQLSLGPDIAHFDGSSTGHFVGNSSGQYLAINAESGFAGDLINAAVHGSRKFKVDNAGTITLADAANIVTGTTTGLKLGTAGGASGQKLGFFNATPIVQPLLATGAAHTVDDVITTLQNLGLCRQT